jgi:glycosyltransferase involved in cell wall biosynthesis
MSKITVGLPTYNRAELLPDCIASVLNQSYPDWELLISDDHSSDDTPEVAKSLMKLDKRITYFRQEHRVFLPKNRNTICSLSNGKLIFFIEDDLLLDRNCLLNLIKSFQTLSSCHKLGALTPRMITVGEFVSESKTCDVVHIDKWTGLIQSNFDYDCDTPKKIIVGHACSLILKQAWVEIKGYDENRYKGTNFREETDFYFRLKQKEYEIFFIPNAVVYHKRHKLGGCHSSRPLKDNYFYARNHIMFLLRFYKLTSFYRVPLFLLYLAYRLIGKIY